jgi:HSP20 family protein
MGIMDKVTSILPWRGDREESQPARPDALAFRDDLDRWLGQLFTAPVGFGETDAPQWAPAVNVHETDKELVVTAEIPGLDRKDVELAVGPQGLIIRGEKREEREDRRRDYHVVESRYGSFVRTVPLPAGLTLDRAEAQVKNGVLTVRFPKATGAHGSRRVPIRA